jgi:polysaccharide biosynthesis/export protein
MTLALRALDMSSTETLNKFFSAPVFCFCFPILATLVLVACSVSNSTVAQNPPALAQQADHGAAPSGTPQRLGDDGERLAQIWQRRSDRSVADYRVGPNDLVEILVPGMEELKSNLVRVSNEGTISLAFVGVLQVAGQTEEQLKEQIIERLNNYMHNPRVNVLVREYRARQVAIIGAVAKPGLYSLTTGTETLLDAISLAGGMTGEAAPRIILIAADSETNDLSKNKLALAMVPQVADSKSVLQKADPIIIDLDRLAREGNQMYFALPVRSGDVLMVPARGEVLVEGWVEKPGSYRITPGLTVLGAVAAAGGAAYAADRTAVTLMRSAKNGEKIFFPADLEKIRHGQEIDISVQEGDVIQVPSSNPRLVAYGFYRVLSTVVHIGANVPLW